MEGSGDRSRLAAGERRAGAGPGPGYAAVAAAASRTAVAVRSRLRGTGDPRRSARRSRSRDAGGEPLRHGAQRLFRPADGMAQQPDAAQRPLDRGRQRRLRHANPPGSGVRPRASRPEWAWSARSGAGHPEIGDESVDPVERCRSLIAIQGAFQRITALVELQWGIIDRLFAAEAARLAGRARIEIEPAG